VIRIAYGMPGPELIAASERDEVALGGRIIEDGRPTRSCKACGHEWGNIVELLDDEEEWGGYDGPLDLGPTVRGDPPFRAQMRRHQSWWRAAVLGLDYGPGPSVSSATRYGNFLTTADAEQGANFLTPQIFDVVRRRLAERTGAVSRDRLLRDLLSSQPMCFNLFAPLVDDLDLATRLVGALLPGEIERVTGVRIEWAPTPKREYLDENTAFDCFIDFRLPDGSSSFLAIETKLTDSFSKQRYDAARYLRVTRHHPEFWDASRLEHLNDARWSQLWRNHLLAVVLVDHPDPPYTSGRVAVVRHHLDDEGAVAVAAYKGLLHDPDVVSDLTLDRIVAAWRPLAETPQQAEWLDAFHERYVDLSASAS
jgi:hypothetical protein